MDCNRAMGMTSKCLLAVVVLAACGSTLAFAEAKRGLVYNPVTQQMEPAARTRRIATWSPEQSSAKKRPQTAKKAVHHEPVESQPEEDYESIVEQASYEGEEYYDASCPVGGCDDTCTGCGDVCCGDCVGYSPGQSIYVGFEATFVKPRFESNEAFTLMTSDGALFENYNEVDFDYDMEMSPRVFLGWQRCDGIGLRVTWWQFDHSAANLSANPPANGFGEITPPPFDNVDISTNIPTDTYNAASELNAYTIDVEATRQSVLSSWHIGVGGGVRYASAEQRYFSQIIETGNVLRDQIDFQHAIEGIGPTISLNAYRPWSQQFGSFCKARGSVLFGDGDSTLVAGEDLDLANSFTTTRITSRDDLLSIGEIQIGLQWKAAPYRGRVFKPFLTAALEGQIWNGAGNASSEEGNLGFFGFNAGTGFDW